MKKPSRPLGGVAVRRGVEARLAGQKHYADSRRRVTRLDEVKDIRDKAEAMAAYARQAKDQDLILWATEIKVRAERRAGEMLAQMPKNQGAKFNGRGPDGEFRQSIDVSAETLADVGVSPMQSSRWQALAAMPADHFETAVATAKESAGQVTTAFMLREAAKQSQPVPRNSASVTRDGHVTDGIVIWLVVAND
jgi:hypothetical protein